MLGEGLRAGIEYMGGTYRTICHVEREAYAAAVLVARMEEGSLDAAPVWSDICTFDGRRFAGKVDGIVAGFPCQDISIAGKKAGLDGERSGLFFEIPRIADACGAWFLFLENVSAIATATAATVDEAEGELDERSAARIVGELADRGWDAEWITLSASAVGASHVRARWFCLAWRMGHAGLQHGFIQQREVRAKHPRAGYAMGNAASLHGDQRQRLRFGETAAAWAESRLEGPSPPMADAGSTRLQIRDRRREDEETLFPQGRPDAAGVYCALGMFAPGQGDPEWQHILANFPELAPALEPTFCKLVDGLAFGMDDSRAARLKCIGNGVVPLQAAVAFVVLARRAGIFE